MMITTQSHTNKPLISITDGQKVGEIKDLFLDAEARKVIAVHLGSEGLINRTTNALPRAAVQVYGRDAWLIADAQNVAQLETLPDAQTFVLSSDLRGREIVTEGGTRVGAVDDVALDREARVLGFTLGKVYVQGPMAERKLIARDAIRSLGSDTEPMTTVMAQAESLPVATG